MKDTNEGSLTNVKKQGMFYKIKMFFQKLINKKEETNEDNVGIKKTEEEQNSFEEYVKKTEDSQTELLKLQKRFRDGEIKQGELTQEQIDKLCELYDMQIQSIKLSIEVRKKKIEEYRKNNKKV